MTANIGKFLEIFKTAISGDENFREGVCKIVLEKTKFPLDKKSITLKNNSICIKADPYMKTEISLHKEDILKAIQAKYPKKNIRDVF